MRVLTICVLLASAATAHAQPRIAVHATGSCPSAAAITRALPATKISGVELTVEEFAGGVVVTATSPTGPLEARLEGRDCDVLASAVAAIADAWFVELAPRPAPPPMERVTQLAPPSATPRTDVDTVPARPAPAPRWNIALGRGLVMGEHLAQTSTTQADLGWWFHPRARLRVRLDLGDASTLDNVVQRQAFGAIATVAPRLDRGRLWVEAAGGAGVVISRVESMDAASDRLVRAHAALAAGAGAGMRLTSGASLRLDVDARLYPVRDVYSLQATPIARSPRAELAAGVGLEIAFGQQSQ